jgi:glycosyltransferase involved in cell wall biosynthesis
VQLVVPVYNEADNVSRLYERLRQEGVDFDSLKFVYDFDEDTSLPFIEELRVRDERVLAERNEWGRGVLHALRWAFAHCGDGPVVVVMGDNSDQLSIIPEMIGLWRRGATIVAPSRYMRNAKQHGGGFVKSGLSRLAGTSLRMLGFPISDPTNSFKLYDGVWLRRQPIESRGGFEVGLELCYRAFVEGEQIRQLPTQWFDRTSGESRFRLLAWLPHYLKWYFRCLGVLLRPGTRQGRAR